MRRKLLQVDLARALGISASMVSRLKRRGMPTHELAAAIEWRRRHLDVVQVAEQATRRERAGPAGDGEPRTEAADDGSQALERIALLAELAAADFHKWGERLRAELAALSRAHWDEVRLPSALWEKLGGESFQLADADRAPPADDGPDDSPGDDSLVNDFVYMVAAGLMRVLPPSEGRPDEDAVAL